MLSCFPTTPTIEEYLKKNLLCMAVKIIAFELPIMNYKKNDQERLRHSLKERQLQLRDLVANAEKFDYSYDDIISDITESFLSGEKMARNPESLGSSFEVIDDSILESWKLETWRKLASAQCYRL